MNLVLLLLLLFQNTIGWRFTLPKKRVIVNRQKKIISINPGGIFGFYTVGYSSYILKNYNTYKYHFIGASSGSWNSLFCCYKYDHSKFFKQLMNQDFFVNISSVDMLQKNVTNYITKNYKSCDFNLNKLSICISILEDFKLKSLIISNFTNIDDAMEICRLSSHLPYLTSDVFIKKYNNNIVFDGGLTEFPPKNTSIYYEISIDRMNNNNIDSAFCNILKGNISKEIIKNLYLEGYKDCEKNKKEIDKYFGDSDILFYLDYL